MNSKASIQRKSSHIVDNQKFQSVIINDNSVEELDQTQNFSFMNQRNEPVLKLNLTHHGSFGGETTFYKSGFNLNKSTNITNVLNQKFLDTARIEEKLKLPQNFFGGNKFHSKFSNWDPNQSTLIS